ncbi:MAG: hypothetical protein CBD18_01625 [Opitutales bacterium TMED158]|nr:MAG: hypothetical protein CBD18_01625 [Opitutales bacterium TMED158]
MKASRKSNAIALSLSKSATGVMGMLILVALARGLTKEDFAAYQQAILAYAVIAPFLQMGIGQGIYYFLPVEKTRPRGRVVDAIFALGIAGIAYALFLACGGNHLLARSFSNPQVASLLLWMIPYSIFTTPTSQVGPVLIASDRVKTSSAFAILREIAVGMATVLPVLIWSTASAPLIGNAIASSLLGIAAIKLMIQATPPGPSRPSLSAVRELLAYSFPLGLALMLGMLSKQLDKFIVSFMSDPERFAVYALGAMEIPLITIVTGSITAVVMVDLRQAIDEGRIKDSARLFRTIAEKSAYILLPAMFFFLVAADSLMTAFFSNEYAASAEPFRIYLATIPTRIVILGSLLAALGQSKTILKLTFIGLLLNLGLSILLVDRLGPNGAAIATVVVLLLWSVPAYLRAIGRSTGIPWKTFIPWAPLGNATLFLLGPTALIAILEYSLDSWASWSRLALQAILFGTPVILWWGSGKLFTWHELKSRFNSVKSNS